MKKLLSMLLAAVLLTGCGSNTVAEVTIVPTENRDAAETQYVSRFANVTSIVLSDAGITVNGGDETETVFTSRDILYYEDRDTYDSGNPYGEGEEDDRHSAEDAAAHMVVNITAPGAYRVNGKLSAGQIRVDLGEEACADPEAVVELILEDADITCTVAPAILFLNTYECDGDWSTETAQAVVDTAAAGANLILEGSSRVSGSHVAKIFKDKDGEKKLWKQDGAIYSYMSLNVFGPGSLELTADNEGVGTELHLTINGGNIHIYSDNDGINTNEDDVSVTTINGGNLTIFAGLGEEGDGIDSNGYLVINGGSVVSAANPVSDAGLDSSLGSYINGGTVIAMGSNMDWEESDSDQVTMNLQFAQQQKAGSGILITREDGTEIFSFESDSAYARSFSGLILSHAYFRQGETYRVYIDGVQMSYTGNDVGRGGPGGRMPGEQMPEGFDPGRMDGKGQRPDNWEERTPPEGFEGEMPTGPEDGIGGKRNMEREHPGIGKSSTDFYMNDKVNAFSGISAAA